MKTKLYCQKLALAIYLLCCCAFEVNAQDYSLSINCSSSMPAGNNILVGSSFTVYYSSGSGFIPSTNYHLQWSTNPQMTDCDLSPALLAIANTMNKTQMTVTLPSFYTCGDYYFRVAAAKTNTTTSFAKSGICGPIHVIGCKKIVADPIPNPKCKQASVINFTPSYLPAGTLYQLQVSYSISSPSWANWGPASTSSPIMANLPFAYPSPKYFRIVTTNTTPVIESNVVAFTNNNTQFSPDFTLGITTSPILGQGGVYATPVSGASNAEVTNGGADYYWEIVEVTPAGVEVPGTLVSNLPAWQNNTSPSTFPGVNFMQGRCYKVTRCITSCIQNWSCVTKTICVPLPCGTAFNNACDLSSFCNQTKTFSTNNSSPAFLNNYTASNTHGQTSRDVWYKFRVNNTSTGKLVVNTCGSQIDTYIHILDQNRNEVAYNDDASNMSLPYTMKCYTPGTLISGIPSANDAGGVVTLNGGQDYYLVLEGYGSDEGPITGSISIFCCATAPVFVADFNLVNANLNNTTKEYNIVATPVANSSNLAITNAGATYAWSVQELNADNSAIISSLNDLPEWHNNNTSCTFPKYPTSTAQTAVNGIFKYDHNYNVVRTVSSPCQADSYKQWAFRVHVGPLVGATSVDEQEVGVGTLGVYPNPTNDKLYVSYELMEATNVSIALYNLLGEQIKVLHSGMEQVSCCIRNEFSLKELNLAEGIYVVKANLGNKVLIHKFVFNAK